jgi:hypothetical protein
MSAFRLFAEADHGAGMRSGGRYSLADLVPAVEALGPYGGLWTTEGVGYYRAADALEADPDARGILGPEAVRGVPSRWLIPLHTGMGLVLAGQLLGTGPAGVQEAWQDPLRTVQRYLRRCRENVLEGYAGTCVESLGLMAPTLRPDLISVIDRGLSAVGGDLSARFWHGYGRGLYFSPSNVLPCTSLLWPATRRATREPPHDLGRGNALAGLAWAVTLVNIRDPGVIEMFLGRLGRAVSDLDAIADGIRSAAAVWVDWDPGSDYLQSYCAYEPAAASGAVADRWARVARGPCGEEFARAYSWLKSHNRLDDLFRYPSADTPGSRSQ